MRLLGAAGVGVVISGALLMSAQSMSTHKVRTKRQFNYNNRQQQTNYGNGYQSRQGNSNNARQQQQQQQQQQQWYTSGNNNNNNNNEQQYSTDYNALLQQYAALTSAANSNTGYYDTYSNSIADYAPDAYVPAATFASSVSENPDSSPALSALALLGFLYFLNLIQDVLQNNGRRKRSVNLPEETDEGFYSTSYLEDPLIIPEGMEEDDTPGFLKDEGVEIVEEETEEKGDTEQEAAKAKERMDVESPASGRSFSFLENFFIKLPQALGLSWRPPQIDRDGRDESSWDIGNFISSRLKMISSIMSFLQDPRPSRIRRGVPLSEDDVVRINATDQQSFIDRFRRFTHSMNAWYDALGGENYEPNDDSSSGMAAKMASFLGGGRHLQEAVKKDAVPTFLEITKGLDGRHPHCIQRALCRINSHTYGTSFVAKLAIQFLSNQLIGEPSSEGLSKANQRAMAAGREGLNCEDEFPDCSSEAPSTVPSSTLDTSDRK